jgi:hypothetical protein
MPKAEGDGVIAFMSAVAGGPSVSDEGSPASRYRARQGQYEPTSYMGRKPPFGRDQLDTIRDMLAQRASPTLDAETANV